ncbi:GerAB/ArcD/ProY family transporter [Alkalihalobacterium elongatum]|uniref:GerAB/ArcD/ProY family transporter n=1 Tax=Alkalihalobacterium elongatum TaxID=2675466 RepID=UPI001C1FBB37|nr:GerAB/ArcD/ProY family transporter [Alkalihalobacterium elongatum]
MSNKKDYEISPIEMGISLTSLIFGVGILTLPRTLANEVGTTDGWISILLAGFISIGLIYLYTQLQKNFPNRTYLQFLAEGKIGKWVAKFMGILFTIYLVVLVSIQARILAMAVKMYLIDQTPSEVLVAIILLLITYAVSKGVQGIIHIHLMFTPFIFVALFTIMIFNFNEAQFDRLLPVMSEGISPVLYGVLPPMFSFAGVFLLFFFMAYMKESDLRSGTISLFMLATTLIYAFLTITAYGVFGLEMTMVITFPAVELAKEIELIGAFIERFESIFLTIYIMAIFTSMANILFVIHQIFKEQFIQSQKMQTYLPAMLIFLIFLIAFIPNSFTEMQTTGRYVGLLGDGLIISTFIIGFLTVWFRNRSKSSIKNSSSM